MVERVSAAEDGEAHARTRQLGALPVIGQALRRLGIARVVDDLLPPDPRMVVTDGQCVEAMIVSILLGVRPLYLMDQRLAAYDLELGLGWRVEATRFNDQRLAATLLRVAQKGQAITDAAALRSIKAEALDTRLLHLDLTASGVYGRYRGGLAPEPDLQGSGSHHFTRGPLTCWAARDHPQN